MWTVFFKTRSFDKSVFSYTSSRRLVRVFLRRINDASCRGLQKSKDLSLAILGRVSERLKKRRQRSAFVCIPSSEFLPRLILALCSSDVCMCRRFVKSAAFGCSSLEIDPAMHFVWQNCQAHTTNGVVNWRCNGSNRDFTLDSLALEHRRRRSAQQGTSAHNEARWLTCAAEIQMASSRTCEFVFDVLATYRSNLA